MRLRAFAVALAAFTFALVPLAGAMTEAVSATGTVVRNADESYTLEIEVTGDAVQCIRYTAPLGVTIASASGPVPTQVQGGSFGSQGTNITSGTSKSWRFTTSKPLPAAEPGALQVSATCAVGSDVDATLLGPLVSECRCMDFSARILPKSVSLFGRSPTSLNLGFTVSWFMLCSSGLEGCTGTMQLAPPQPAARLGAKLRLVGPGGKLGKATGTFTCQGVCAKQNAGVQSFRLFGKKPLGSKSRANKTYTLTLKRTCQGKPLPQLKFKLSFDRLGQVNKKKSDLNPLGPG